MEDLQDKIAELEKVNASLIKNIVDLDANVSKLAKFVEDNVKVINNLHMEANMLKEVVKAQLGVLRNKQIISDSELSVELTKIADQNSRDDIQKALKLGNIAKVDVISEASIVVFANNETQYSFEKASNLVNVVGKQAGEHIDIPVMDPNTNKMVKKNVVIREIYDIIKK